MIDMDLRKEPGCVSYRVRFTDHNGVRRKLRLAKNKRVSEVMTRQLMQVVDHAAAGAALPDDLLAWVQTLGNKRVEQLKGWGLVDEQRLATANLLADNIELWRTGLIARGRSEAYARTLYLRVVAVAEEAEFTHWRGVDDERVLSAIDNWRQAKKVPGYNRTTDVSEATLRHYLQAFKQFCKWWVAKGYAPKNPMATVPGELRPTSKTANVSNMAQRRPLTEDEQRRLLTATKASTRKCKASGPERALLYRTALMTGLRAGALRRLTAGDVDRDGWLNAHGLADNKKSTPKPIGGALLTDLLEHAGMKAPAALLFNLPRPEALAAMLRKDAEDASINTEGIDFHSLRHSFGTALARQGVHPKTLMALMDHATIQVTMKLYTHSMPEDEIAAMNRLADPDQEQNSRPASVR